MNTNIFGFTFFGKYKYKYIPVDFFLAKTNTNIFRSHFLEKYKYIWAEQKWANINANEIILIDICEYEYEYVYYHTQNLKKYMLMYIKAIKVFKCMSIFSIIYNLLY